MKPCTLPTLLLVLGLPAAALALTPCKALNECKPGVEICYGGVCVPQKSLCKADGDCAAWQRCSFDCPLAGTTTSVSVEPAPRPDGSPGSDGSGSSGDQQAGAPADPGFAEKKPGPTGEETCQSGVGICVADKAKLPVDEGCKALCAAAAACGEVGGGSSGSTGSSTEPAPGAGGGSAGSGEEKDAAPPAGAPEFAPPKPGEEPGGEPGGEVVETPQTEDAVASCAFMCTIWKLEQVAPAELGALAQCVADTKDNCSAMKEKCQAAAEAFMSKADANDYWTVVAGEIGFGMAGGTAPDSPTSGDGSTGVENQTGGAGGPKGGSGSGAGADAESSGGGGRAASSGGGCSAGGVSDDPAALFALLTALGLLRRRRSR